MTLPRDIHGPFLGVDGNIINKGAPPPVPISKPTARILPLLTNNSNLNTSESNASITFNYNCTNQNNFGPNSVFLEPYDLSEDIATANIKTKISQFEYLASRNYDRCPKFPVYPEKDMNFRDGRINNGEFKQQNDKCRQFLNGNQKDDNEMVFNSEKGGLGQQKMESCNSFYEDPEQIERKRLEEILTICAEYEKQAQFEKSTKLSPNRIKTNGSLPRERRNNHTDQPSSSSPQINPPDQYNPLCEVSPFTFDIVPPNSACSAGKQRSIFDFNNLQSPCSIKDLDLLSEQLKKSCAVEHVSRNRIKTTMTTSYRDGHQTSPYSTPQSPQFPNRFIQKHAQTSSPLLLQNLPPANQNSFKYLTLPKDTKLVSGNQQREDFHRIGGNKFNTFDAENLIAMRKDMERAMIKLKTKLSENENYYEELVREFELEKALLIAEYKSRLTEKRNLQSRQQICLQRVQLIENVITETKTSKDNDQIQCGEKLATAQETVKDIESNLSVLSANKNSDDYQLAFDKYLVAQEVLDNERKAFEDVEFHHLEKEADLLASKEELQRELRDLCAKMDELNICLKDLKSQLDHITHTHSTTHNQLERSKLALHKRIEEIRTDLKLIDLDMNSNSSTNKRKPSNGIIRIDENIDQDYNSSSVNTDTEDECSDCDSTRSSGSYVLRGGGAQVRPGQNDLGRHDGGLITQSVNEAMLGGNSAFWEEFSPLEKKTPSQGDIDRICKVTSSSPMNIIDESVNLGKKTIESLMEIERNRHLHLVETGSEVIEKERRRVSELKQKAQEEVRNEWARRKPEFSSTLNTTGHNPNISDDENNSKSRNSSDNNSVTTANAKEMDLELASPSGNFKRSTAKDKQRPLTRYLPIRSADLDLRQHIVSAGHQVILCQYVSINSSICKGFLHKKRSKFNNWSRRWFVFDRTKRSLVYYTDKNEKKTKGGSSFQSIQDVYLDHSNSIKSPSPHLTFVMKTQQRIFYLMAPSAEAMRIWIDVIFTGAEGYSGFGQNF